MAGVRRSITCWGRLPFRQQSLAERVAAAMLMEAKHPVITVNGNAAALAAKELIELSRAVNARLEVNLFHRSVERIELVCGYLESLGATGVLGRTQDFTLPGIASDRALCTNEGIGMADVVLIPLEDGDRAEALVKAGKKVIAIDLNPVSRTSMAADVSITDELTRAVPNLISHVGELTDDGGQTLCSHLRVQQPAEPWACGEGHLGPSEVRAVIKSIISLSCM